MVLDGETDTKAPVIDQEGTVKLLFSWLTSLLCLSHH
ncbi:hypothetical protein ABIA64_005337 [Paenibacillus sp. RC253]